MKVTVQKEISNQRIADLMTSAIESGMSRYWCDGVYLISVDGKPYDPDSDVTPEWAKSSEFPGLWYACPDLYARRFIIDVVDAGTGKRVHRRVGRARMVKAFHIMADKYVNHLRDVLEENDDACTADLFLQLFALGEEVYG